MEEESDDASVSSYFHEHAKCVHLKSAINPDSCKKFIREKDFAKKQSTKTQMHVSCKVSKKQISFNNLL